ncbi:MAG: hypothetical protein ACKVJG_24470 [Candidatus Latescibacterota bacterium]
MQWAQLQPRIVYDETLLRDGLEGVRVLVLPGTEVLTEGVGHVHHCFPGPGRIGRGRRTRGTGDSTRYPAAIVSAQR